MAKGFWCGINGKLEYYIPKDDGIDDETARRITEEADKACARCKDLNCWECEYRHWRSKSFVITKSGSKVGVHSSEHTD